MFKIKLYKYDSSQEQNGYRGEDFSKHILQGGSITEDITQELDTAELTLCGLNFEKCFEPETKFILDVVDQDGNVENILKNYHFVVFEDVVSKPILSNDNYFDHHISFIEPSVVAQKRLVDNIATTYKIKDVSLQERVDYPDTKIVWDIDSSYFTPPEYQTMIGAYWDIWGVVDAEISHPIAPLRCSRGIMGKYFQKEGELRAINRNGEEFDTSFTDIENFNDGTGNYYAKFRIPKIQIIKGYRGTDLWGNEKLDAPDATGVQLLDNSYASIDYVIQELVPNDPSNVTNTIRGSFISNSRIGWSSWSEDYDSVDFSADYPTEVLDGEWLLEEIKQPESRFHFYYKKYTNTNAVDPTYITQEIPIRPDRQYVITISLHQFEDNLPSKYNETMSPG